MCTPPQERVILGPIYDRALQRGDAPISPEGELLAAQAIAKLGTRKAIDSTPKSARKPASAKQPSRELELEPSEHTLTDVDTENITPPRAGASAANVSPQRETADAEQTEQAEPEEVVPAQVTLDATDAWESGPNVGVSIAIGLMFAAACSALVALAAIMAALKTSGVPPSTDELGVLVVSLIEPVPSFDEVRAAIAGLGSAAAAVIGPDVAAAAAINLTHMWRAATAAARKADELVPAQLTHGIAAAFARALSFVCESIWPSDVPVSDLPKLAEEPAAAHKRSSRGWMEEAMMLAS